MSTPSAPRYAIYFAPSASSRLWRWGCAWLGRDAAQGEPVARPTVDGYDDAALARHTATAARYGFHATLKSPFRLTAGATEAQLLAAMAAFARGRTPFAAPPLAVGLLDGFVALMPTEPAPALNALADACVRDFDRFRAPPTEAEIARRQAASPLSPHQQEYLHRWGYPYVLGSWRFHMTLTERLKDADRNALLPAIEALFRPLAPEPLHVGGIALFKQAEEGGAFRLIARAPCAP